MTETVDVLAENKAFWAMDRREWQRQWLQELREAQRKPRVLWDEDPNGTLPGWEKERCVICQEKKTTLWLMPENAPLCSDECKDEYLKDPTVYDPRGLYRLQTIPSTKPRTGGKKERWEPSDEEIQAAQKRIAERLRGK